MNNIYYKNKYLKYKNKYLIKKIKLNLVGGTTETTEVWETNYNMAELYELIKTTAYTNIHKIIDDININDINDPESITPKLDTILININILYKTFKKCTEYLNAYKKIINDLFIIINNNPFSAENFNQAIIKLKKVNNFPTQVPWSDAGKNY